MIKTDLFDYLYLFHIVFLSSCFTASLSLSHTCARAHIYKHAHFFYLFFSIEVLKSFYQAFSFPDCGGISGYVVFQNKNFQSCILLDYQWAWIIGLGLVVSLYFILSYLFPFLLVLLIQLYILISLAWFASSIICCSACQSMMIAHLVEPWKLKPWTYQICFPLGFYSRRLSITKMCVHHFHCNCPFVVQ